MNNIGYVRCSKCEEVIYKGKKSYAGAYLLNPTETDFKCYYCGHYDQKKSQLERFREEDTKDIVRKMINYLQSKYFSEIIISIEFPNRSTSSSCWGETLGYINAPFPFLIRIPKQTLYLPHDQITDTTAHESAHVSNWELGKGGNRHAPEWEKDYHDYRADLFRAYSWFVNSYNPNALFSKGYNKRNYNPPRSYWQAEYALQEEEYSLKADKDMIFDPYND